MSGQADTRRLRDPELRGFPGSAAVGRAAPSPQSQAIADALAEPRRLTPTERLHEVTMAALTRAPSQPEHSVDLTRNAKGATQIALTVRGTDARDVLALAFELYDTARARYPLPSGYVGAEGEPAEPKPVKP